jgi:pentatricopeptide repeat protein
MTILEPENCGKKGEGKKALKLLETMSKRS